MWSLPFNFFHPLILAHIYPVRICAVELCIWSRPFVYIICIHNCQQKTGCLVPYRSKISCYVYVSHSLSLSINTNFTHYIMGEVSVDMRTKVIHSLCCSVLTFWNEKNNVSASVPFYRLQHTILYCLCQL